MWVKPRIRPLWCRKAIEFLAVWVKGRSSRSAARPGRSRIGARPSPLYAPADVCRPIRHRPLSLSGGNRSICPKLAIAQGQFGGLSRDQIQPKATSCAEGEAAEQVGDSATAAVIHALRSAMDVALHSQFWWAKIPPKTANSGTHNQACRLHGSKNASHIAVAEEAPKSDANLKPIWKSGNTVTSFVWFVWTSSNGRTERTPPLGWQGEGSAE